LKLGDQQAYLTDLLGRIHDHKVSSLDDLLPWNWQPRPEQAKAA
jgi:transposase